MPRAVPVRDPLMQPSRAEQEQTSAELPHFSGKIVEVQVVHDGHAYSSPLRVREFDDYSHASSRPTATTTTSTRDAVRQDYSYSSPRRGRVNPNEDDYYIYRDSVVEAMPPPLVAQRQPNSRGITSSRSNYSHDGASISSGSRRNRGDHVYEQEDSMIEPMPTMARPALKAPPTPSCCPMDSYEDALARKMAAFEKPAAKKKKAVAALPPAAATPMPSHLIEIAPGVSARLRGAQETMNCIANDFYLPTTCFACDTNLFCIMDADYVLCPLCKVVSPVSEKGDTDGGIGLGFTFDDLQHYTAEILRERRG